MVILTDKLVTQGVHLGVSKLDHAIPFIHIER